MKMKKILLITAALVILIGLLYAITAPKYEPVMHSKVGTNNAGPARVEACNKFMASALFPDEGAADIFFLQCIRGEKVLPEDTSSEPSIETKKKCDEIMVRSKFSSKEAMDTFYKNCLAGTE